MALRSIGRRRPSEVRAAFRRAVRRQIRIAEGLARRDLQLILVAFQETERRLVRQLAVTGIDADRVQGLRDAARREIGLLSERLKLDLDASQQRAARAGVQLVTEPLGELSSGLGVTPSIGLPPELASVTAQFSADLIGLNSGGLASQVLKAINTQIGLAAIGGRTSSQAIEAISRALGTGGDFTARAHAIYRTEVLRVHSMASQAAMVKAQELVPTLRKAWLWSGISRKTHQEAGLRYDEDNAIPVDEPFLVDGEQLMYPRDPAGSPANTINCFPAGTEMQGSIVAALRAKYVGPMVKVATGSGKRLAVTPNHPVLTPQGFRPAGALQKGDHVLSYGPDGERGGAGRMADHQHGPAPIEDAFEAFTLRRCAASCGRSLDDLHGDALHVVGEIEVVLANGELLGGRVAPGFEDRSERVLVGAAVSHSSPAGSGPGDTALHGIRRPASGRPSVSTLAQHLAAVALEVGPDEPARLGSVAEWNIARPQPVGDGATSDAVFLRELLDAHAGEVFADQVVDVTVEPFVGHVFDLQSSVGWIVANGILTSNCGCQSIPVIADFGKAIDRAAA